MQSDRSLTLSKGEAEQFGSFAEISTAVARGSMTEATITCQSTDITTVAVSCDCPDDSGVYTVCKKTAALHDVLSTPVEREPVFRVSLQLLKSS